MARSDLLISLVQAATSGDMESLHHAVETVIADARAKKHAALADRLERELKKNGTAHALSGRAASGNGTLPHMGAASADASVHDLWVEMAPARSLDDLILADNVTTVCREVVQEQRCGELLGSHGLKPRSRILLAGPPGNGKTALAEAVAGALAAPLIAARYDGVIAGGLAESALRLRRLFDYARARRCVLFFDDFETIARERGSGRESGVMECAAASLLRELDSLPAHVVVVAATNHAELLDRAVWRRFPIRLELPPPTVEQTVQFFERVALRADIPLGYAPRMIAPMLQGMSYAELEDFASDVGRRYVLSLPESDAKKIIAQCLDQWKKRFRAS